VSLPRGFLEKSNNPSFFVYKKGVWMSQQRSFGSLVSPKELKSALTKVKVLDGSWHMPNTNRDPYKEFLQKRIVGSRFFGIDTIKDATSDLPHMLPSPDRFADAVGKIIKNLMIPSILTHVVIHR
jgi:hypothetical protein